MRNFQEKNGLRRIFQSRPALALLGIIVLVFAWNVIVLVGKMEDTAKNKKIAEDKITELKKEKDSLSAEIEKLNTDSGKEADIRDKFGLVKEGEGLVVVVDDQNTSGATLPKESGFLAKIKSWFK